MGFIISLISVALRVFDFLIIAWVAASYLLSPYHAVRQSLDRIVEPMVAPIRRIIPLIGMFDFSPLVLLLLVHALANALINLLFALT